jgi:hypothetical protein
MESIVPQWRWEPFDHPHLIFELKYNGFRDIADTVHGRMLSKHLNHLKRYDPLLSGLPAAASSMARSQTRV